MNNKAIEILAGVKAHLITEESKRKEVVALGARAYHLGIEQRDCPLTALSEKNLWNEGYRIAQDAFSALLRRQTGGHMH
jgi:hypothetical protein